MQASVCVFVGRARKGVSLTTLTTTTTSIVPRKTGDGKRARTTLCTKIYDFHNALAEVADLSEFEVYGVGKEYR